MIVPSRAESAAPPLLAVSGLRIDLDTPDGTVPLVRGVDLDVAAGECVGLVGESGSGKTLTALALLRLLPPGMRVSRWPGRANTKQILRHWGESHLPRDLVERRKRNFNYGTVRELLAEDTARVHDRMLGASALRRALPGLETWLGHPREYFRGPWEGTMWALLSLGIWAEATGIR